MKYLEESNKNLISLRASLITVVVVLTGGLVGLFIADVKIGIKMSIILLGLYFDFILLNDIAVANNEIKRNIGAMKNDRR